MEKPSTKFYYTLFTATRTSMSSYYFSLEESIQATRSLLAWRDYKAYDLKICFKASFSLHFSQRTDLILSHALNFQHRWSQCWTVGLNVPATLCAQRLLHHVPSQLVWLGSWAPGQGKPDLSKRNTMTVTYWETYFIHLFLDPCVSWPVLSMT